MFGVFGVFLWVLAGVWGVFGVVLQMFAAVSCILSAALTAPAQRRVKHYKPAGLRAQIPMKTLALENSIN